MEWIAVVGVGVIFGIPAIAVIALLRSRAAERKGEEKDHNLSALQNDIVALRRELTKLSDRVGRLEISKNAGAERDEASQPELPLSVVATPRVEQTRDPLAESLAANSFSFEAEETASPRESGGSSRKHRRRLPSSPTVRSPSMIQIL